MQIKFWLFAGSMMMLASQAHAQANSSNNVQTDASGAPKIEEVVVTAQKRSENIQNVPLSIVAFSGEQLAKSGINNVIDLQHIVPDFSITTIAQVSGVTLRIRGFGTASNAAIDPDVAPYIDGIYIPRPGAILTSFLDVSNVEVLRGPQGTLFGRNATVGAVEISTNAPSFSHAYGEASVEAASYNTFKLQAVENMPLSDTFAIRAAGFVSDTDGYFKNEFDGQTYGASTTEAGRLSAKWSILPSLTWIGRLDFSHTTGDGVNLAPVDTSTATTAQLTAFSTKLGGAPPPFRDPPGFTGNQRFDSPSVNDVQTGLSSDLTWDVGAGYKLRLVDSYREWRNKQTDGDIVDTTLDLVNRHAAFESISQSHEIQFISPTDKLLGGRLSFVAGLYYFDENYSIHSVFDLGSQYCSFVVKAAKPTALSACMTGPQIAGLSNQFHQDERSYAGYAQADFKLTQTLVLTIGARETADRKVGSFVNVSPNAGGTVLGAVENDPHLGVDKAAPTWRANLSWHITPNVMTFASASTGYKSGGFNSAGATPTALTPVTRTFQDETSIDYELGVKSVLFERRLLLNADIFETDIHDFQDRSFNGLSFIIKNAGNIRARGAEIDGQFQATDHIKFEFGGDYLDSIFSSNPDAPGLPACTGAATSCPTVQNLTGRPTDYAPKWQGNMAAEYDSSPFFNGFLLQIRPDVSYVDRMYTTNDLNPQSIVKSHALLDVRINIINPTKSWTLTFYGTNVTDEHYFTAKFAQTLDSLLGVRVPATGATLLRGFVGAPMILGVKLAAKF